MHSIDANDIRELMSAQRPRISDDAGEKAINQRNAWTLKLINQTILMCQNYVPHYRDLWRKNNIDARDIQSFEDFQNIPLTRKSDIIVDVERFLNEIEPRSQIRDTSGTTGKRLTIYGNHSEQDAINALKQGVVSGEPLGGIIRVLPPMKRSVTIPGLVQQGIVKQQICYVTAYEKARFDSYDNILDVIFQNYKYLSSEPFSIMHVTPPFLLEGIMDAFDARGVDMQLSPIRKVMITGNFVFSNVRKRLAEQWNATTITSFSCTEVMGEARECTHRSNVFHVGATMHADVLDPSDFKSVGVGKQGLLALTSLSPFQTVTPFIRYITGDLVKNLGQGCKCGDPGRMIYVSGRHSQCCDLYPAIDEHLWIGPFEIGEALSLEKTTAQLPFRRFNAFAEGIPGQDVGRLVIQVEAVNSQAFDSDAASQRIAARLIEMVPGLVPHFKRGLRIEIDFFQRGTLLDHWAFYPNR